MRKIVLLYILIIICNLFTFDTAALTGDASADNWINKSDALMKEALARDISKADFNHLKSIAMSLGLKEEDNAAAYRNSLCSYYGIKLMPETIWKGEKIILEKAGELKMIKFKEDDEENINILGRARIILNNKDETGKQVSRTIEADSIYIDLKNKEITGLGNILFKDETLEFNGSQFYYNFELNRGVLFGGKTQILSSGSSGLKDAFFEGEKIVQTGNDDSILYNGNLTTCDEIDPHYYIQVSRIWISQKGEWGILNGIVYIGKTPFYYIPFYYHPRDFFLNPSFGFKSREGWFINTTYFVLGQKFEMTGVQNAQTTGEVTLSGVEKNRAINQNALLTITKADLDQKLREFYVKHEFYEKHPKFKFFPNFNSVSLSLRLFADAYTNLGFYTGAFFYMKYDRTNFSIDGLTILSDYALSRLLYKDTATDLYYPYNPADLNNGSGFATVKNQSPLQLRSSQWLKMTGYMKSSSIKLAYDLQLEYASDAAFYKDFYARKLSFTYIDLLSDTLKYAILSQKKKLSNFVFQSDVSSDSKPEINSSLSFTMTPEKTLNIYGLPLISTYSIKTEAKVSLMKTNIPDYTPRLENGYVDDPLYQRFMLNTFQIPSVNTNVSGTILDYDVFVKMPDAYRSQKKIDTNIDEKIYLELYSDIENKKKADASKDLTELDYKTLVPFYAKKNKIAVKSETSGLKYNDVVFYNENSFYEIKDQPTSSEVQKMAGIYFNVNTIEPKNKVANPGIIFVSFKLNYSLTDTMTSTFRFTRDSTGAYDTLQQILSNSYHYKDYLQGYNINNNLNFVVSGSYLMFEYNGSSIWRTSPKLTISYRKDWDEKGIYDEYLLRLYPNDEVKRKSNKLALIKTNQGSSEFSIYYEDVLNNEMSFGNYLIKGTGLATNMRFKLFKNNSLREDNFFQLYDSNSNKMPEFPNGNLAFYDNRAAYEKVEYLYSRFTLNFNCFPEESSHKLSISMAPKVNWILTSGDLLTLKNSVFQDNSSDISYTSANIEEAKDYLCYREITPSLKAGGRSNLYDKIYEFYRDDKFWKGPMNFRKIFEDVTVSQNYSYKYRDFDLIVLNNSLIFKLVNMGGFSKGPTVDPAYTVFGIYPDEIFSAALFKSIFNYGFRLEFSKTLNSNFVYETADHKVLDQYSIMTFTNTHTFSVTLPGTLFPLKLPKGNWLSFSSTTVFKWNTNVRWHNNTAVNNPNFYYLESQTVSTSILMDIFKFSLNFKAFDFQSGYGFELNSGRIDIGYTVTEIPVFWDVFKFNIAPMLSFEFYTNHKGYYEGTTLMSYSPSYYSNNKLSVSLMMELIIGEKTDYETKFHFEIASQNSKMYLFYEDKENDKPGIQLFFEDIGKSFNFGNVEERKQSNFKLKSILFSVEHKLHDWNLKFQYSGAPQKSDFSGRYYWENNFSFEVVWNIQSENQLMKMFNKTKINNTYEKGEWKQPVLSLDPDQK